MLASQEGEKDLGTGLRAIKTLWISCSRDLRFRCLAMYPSISCTRCWGEHPGCRHRDDVDTGGRRGRWTSIPKKHLYLYSADGNRRLDLCIKIFKWL